MPSNALSSRRSGVRRPPICISKSPPPAAAPIDPPWDHVDVDGAEAYWPDTWEHYAWGDGRADWVAASEWYYAHMIDPYMDYDVEIWIKPYPDQDKVTIECWWSDATTTYKAAEYDIPVTDWDTWTYYGMIDDMEDPADSWNEIDLVAIT